MLHQKIYKPGFKEFCLLHYYVIKKNYFHNAIIYEMRTTALFFFLLFCFFASGQNTIGLPEIINYSKQAYNAGTQNWDIGQDKNGIVYFGNNEGLLSFDGTFWKLYPLPNHTIVRAIEISKDDKIYIGGQNELGYFLPDNTGQLIYHSLINLIPKQDRSFDDVWNICIYNNAVFFRTNRRLFQFSNNIISVYPTTSEWRFLGVSNNMLLAQDLQNGSLLYQNGIWIPFLNKSCLSPRSLITSFISLNQDSSLIATLKDGLYVYSKEKVSKIKSPDLNKLSGKIIYKAILVDKNHLAIATSFNGCHIIDEKGNLIQSLTHQEGLQDNSIRSIFLDRNNNVWLGLDNGIDFIAYNNSIKHIYPETQNIGSGYSALIFKNQLYLGTSNGLYRVMLDSTKNLSYVKRPLELVANSKGQVWNVSEVNNEVLMGHHEGAFIINDNHATLLDSSSGFWTFLPFSNIVPSSLMIAGNYSGLSFFHFKNGRFQKAKINAQFESARFVVIDNEKTIWVAHPYKGLYKINLNADSTTTIKLYNQNNGLFSANNNFIFKVKNRIVVATEKGLYEYNNQKDAFEISAYFENIFHQTSIRYLKEDPSGNIWFIHEKDLGVVDFSGSSPKIIYFPELNNKLVSGFENIYPFDDHNIFIGGEKGFYHVDYEKYKQNNNSLETQVRLVRALGKTDSLVFGGYFNKSDEQSPQILYSLNSLHFEYSAILYGQQSNIEYSYYLKGFDKGWSTWSNKPEKDYTNLPAGDYSFQIKARNNLGNESYINSYSFTILPPWYQTYWAYLIYIFLFLVLVYYLYSWQRKKFLLQAKHHRQQQEQLQYLHQLEIEKNEKEIVKLKNEKLEAEIEHKNSELANSAMHLVQKREMIAKMKHDLHSLTKKIDNEEITEEFKKVLKMLGEDHRIDNNWEQFAHHFDKVHSDFLVVLKNRHPALSANELKLCAYLRMNLSSKEIAQLMNISIRGVEVSRYRLRKKLGIVKETNLFDFLINEQSGKPKIETA